MKTPPLKIDGAKVLSFCVFDKNIQKHENPSYRVSDTQNAKGLAICQYHNKNQFYLFFCDEDWETLNDTDHDNFEEAKAAAESIYQGLSNLWQKMIKIRP